MIVTVYFDDVPEELTEQLADGLRKQFDSSPWPVTVTVREESREGRPTTQEGNEQ